MGEDRAQRRLTAILAADAVGYSRLMSADEEATVAAIKRSREMFAREIADHHGRLLDTAGDSVLAEFDIAVEAVRCAIAMQRASITLDAVGPAERRMSFRIGINLGDVIADGETIYGEGVNIAARLQALAEPGGIRISGAVYQLVHDMVGASFQDLGKQALKNIPFRIETYRVLWDPVSATRLILPKRSLKAILTRRNWWLVAGATASLAIVAIWFASGPPLTRMAEPSAAGEIATQQADKSSIIVLPFINRSDDPGQEYFVDGITEDIIIELSRLSNLTVFARNTSFHYKGELVKPQVIGKNLGVRYVLDGSVRKSGGMLRITTQLTDAATGASIWAEHYDRKLADVFELQDEVTKKIVSVLAVKLSPVEKGQLGRSGTYNLAAYDSFLRGQQYFRLRTKEANVQSGNEYRRAIELDAGYARAYGALAVANAYSYLSGWTEQDKTLEHSMELAQKAVMLDPSSPEVYWALGFIYTLRRQYDEAAAAANQTVTLAPNYADGYALLAFINNWQGKSENAFNYIRKAMALNPHYSYEYPWNLGLAYYFMGRYPEAVEALKEALQRNENALQPRLFLAASYVRLGRQGDAEWEVEQARMQQSDTNLTQLASSLPIKKRDQLNAVLSDLRKAGLPDR